MKFKDIQKLSDVKFRRLSGVSWATFNLMLAELNKHGSRLADLHLILPNEVPQLSC